MFAGNDNTAIGFTSVIQRAALRIPQDLSAGGYNDIPLVARLAVPLTSMPFREIASAAVDELVNSTNGQAASPNRQRVLAPTLIPRASTGRRSYPLGNAKERPPWSTARRAGTRPAPQAWTMKLNQKGFLGRPSVLEL